MGFIKVGDPVNIDKIIVDGEIALCKDCGEPMVVIKIDEDDTVKPVCNCKYPEMEPLNA